MRQIINYVFSALLFISLIFNSSCREDSTQQNPNKVKISAPKVKNERLFFSNKESLQHHYNSLKDASDEEIASFIDKLNYIPLRPILTEKNERIVSQKLKKRIAKFRKKQGLNNQTSRNQTLSDEEIIDNIDDLEEIIGDDAYGAFLNQNGEIQVAEKIYKYTDVGLFIVNENKYVTLEPYLESKNISNELLIPTPHTSKMNYISSQPCGMLVNVLTPEVEGDIEMGMGNIEYFNDLDCSDMYTGGGSGSGGGSSSGNNNQTPDDDVRAYLENLSSCNPRTGTLHLFGLFGDSQICKDKYERRRRVKTKAFNYNYHLVYNLGVKVKHQYRGWTGIWRKEKCDEIRLGVESAVYFYDYTSFFNPENINNTHVFHNNKMIQYDAGMVTWDQNNIQISSYSINNFPDILKDDIVIEQFSNNSLINMAIASGNTHITAEKLNSYFWNYAIPKVGELFEQINESEPVKNNITLVYKYLEPHNPGKVVINKMFYKKKSNVAKVSRNFDWGFQAGFILNPDNGNISPSLDASALKKPKAMEIKMYGIAKKNGAWHGSKINTTSGN